MEKKLIAVYVLACLLSACATTNDQAASDQSRDEGTYVTGSRLPQRTSGASAVQRVGKEDWEDATRGKQVNPQGR